MNELPDHDDLIEEIASKWLVERAEGFSAARKRDFERWCQADPRHARAVGRLEAACDVLEKMPLVRAELQPVVEFPVKPRTILPAKRFPVSGIVITTAAAVALLAIGWWQWDRSKSSAQIYATSMGGYGREMLADGSLVELNANSEVRVDLLAKERRVALVKGEAHFTVAHDTARPFIVSTHGVAVRAVGTAFNVRLQSSAVEVLVTEGTVSVSGSGPATGAGPSRSEARNRNGAPEGAGPTLLSANERALIVFTPPEIAEHARRAPVVEKIAPDAIREALSWQERKFVFAETPLRDVAAQFNRRNRLQLIVDDPALAVRPIGGTFAADNVEGFVRLLEDSGTITVERRDGTTVVLHAAR